MKIFVIDAILFSIFISAVIFFNLHIANVNDKIFLKAVDIRKTNLEYTGQTNWYKIDSSETGGATVSANTFNDGNKVYFKVTAATSVPQVQVKTSPAPTTKALELAKANIIDV